MDSRKAGAALFALLAVAMSARAEDSDLAAGEKLYIAQCKICHGSVSAYGVFNHRHGAEIEQGLGGPVTFVPHLVPLDRGILETIYTRLTPGSTEDTVAAIYEEAYGHAPFVRLVGPSLPEIKHVAHTNFCDLGWRVDASGRAVLVAVIDNLVKGAAGQAVQNMNVMLGLDQTTGLL